jgi:hypothetical protein
MTIDASKFKGVELIVAVDVSYSMNEPMKGVETERKDCTRMEFVRDFLKDLSEEVMKIDQSGFEIVFFGKDVKVWEGVDDPDAVPERVDQILKEKSLRRGTATAKAINAVYDIYLGHKKNPGHKATVCLFLTDGEPTTMLVDKYGKKVNEEMTPKEEVQKVINTIARKVDDKKFGISMCQVGDNKAAGDWLQYLDDMNRKHDIIDHTSFKNLMYDEGINLVKLCHKALTD